MPKFEHMPKDVKKSLDELKHIFETSIEYIEQIQNDLNYDLDDNIRWLVHDFSNLDYHYQNTEIVDHLKILNNYNDRLKDPENSQPEINPNDKFWKCSECENKITENTCNEFLKGMCVSCINSMTSG